MFLESRTERVRQRDDEDVVLLVDPAGLFRVDQVLVRNDLGARRAEQFVRRVAEDEVAGIRRDRVAGKAVLGRDDIERPFAGAQEDPFHCVTSPRRGVDSSVHLIRRSCQGILTGSGRHQPPVAHISITADTHLPRSTAPDVCSARPGPVGVGAGDTGFVEGKGRMAVRQTREVFSVNVCTLHDVRLLVGPSSGGKSTFVKQLEKSTEGEIGLHFTHQLDDPSAIPTGPNDIVHFNFLRGHRRYRTHGVDLRSTPLLTELLEAAEEVIVLAAPQPVLRVRSQTRTVCEPDQASGKYPTKTWVQALDSPLLAQTYEHLALWLDELGTPHRYLCSNGDAHEEFHPVSRWEFPRLATRESEQLCREGHNAPKLDVGPRSYQADYRDGSAKSARSATLNRALQIPLAGKRVIDIGCAEGAAALSAERMGARVTAIEPWGRRFDQACAIARALDSSIDLRKVALEGVPESSDAFDVVLALNVIHHQRDPFGFLDRAADLASSYLVLEYPGLGDRKFRSTIDGPVEASEEMPLIGLSTTEQDQTFVFNPASLERYLLDTTGVFGRHQLLPSPKSGRWISVFSDKRKAASARNPAAEAVEHARQLAEKDAEIERLNRVVRRYETSKSWRMTAPLRKAYALGRQNGQP